jgi:cytochrome c biogenesis protein CcdA
MDQVGLLVAFAAGVLALLSPCSALLVPSFFAYAFAGRTMLLKRTLGFYAGLLLTLVPLGTGASFASNLFYGHRGTLIAVAGWTLVALGVLQVLGGTFAMPFANRLQGLSGRVRGTGMLSVVALGAVYGLAGFCSGPVLGAILTMAATSSPTGGAVLLAVYALGMAAPMFVLATLWDRLGASRRSWVRGRPMRLGPVRTHTTSVIAGVLFVAIGVLFLRYDGTAGITGAFGLGDTTDLEVSAQAMLTRWLGGIPLWAIALTVAAVAGAAALRRTHAGRSAQDIDPEAPTPAPETVKADTPTRSGGAR